MSTCDQGIQSINFKKVPPASAKASMAICVRLRATVYGLTLASGVLYFEALTLALQSGGKNDLDLSVLKAAMNKVMADKEWVRNIVSEAKKLYTGA